jgi:hypothetical protein
MNEILEIGKAQDLILGEKEIGVEDSGMEPFRREVSDNEEDE